MYICRVVGKVVATIKLPRLGAGSLIMVRRLNMDGQEDNGLLVALDTFGCGEGETVLVTGGTNARFTLAAEFAPIDLSVVGIVDSFRFDSNESRPDTPRPGKVHQPHEKSSKQTPNNKEGVFI